MRRRRGVVGEGGTQWGQGRECSSVSKCCRQKSQNLVKLRREDAVKSVPVGKLVSAF